MRLQGQPRILGKMRKRIGQLAYLWSHPVSHRLCADAVRGSRFDRHSLTSMKYLGDYLSRSMRTDERRRALAHHYRWAGTLGRAGFVAALAKGIVIWEKPVDDTLPPLRITLEPSRLAPMEGELQLRFSFQSDLFVVTFLFAQGEIFGSSAANVLFIGGAQGGVGCLAETREASRLNGEISPASMLMIAVQALARIVRADALLAIADEDHISTGYASDRIQLDYRQFWIDIGGARDGQFFHLPIENESRPLTETARGHRARTRRKREAKANVRLAIERRFGHLIAPPLERRRCGTEFDQRPAAVITSTHHSPGPRSTIAIPCPA